MTIAFVYLMTIGGIGATGCTSAQTGSSSNSTVTAEKGTASASTSSSVSSTSKDTVSSSTSSNAEDTAIDVTDMAGREVKLAKPATKIVVLDAADCEILYAVGAGSSVIGRGEYCDYPADVSSITSVQSGQDTNVEELVALSPDLVIMDEMAQTTDQVEAIENAGIPVAVTAATDIDGVYQAIELIGAVTGKSDGAESVVSQMKSAFSQIEADSTLDGTKTVYFEVSPLEYGLWTAGSGTFMDEIATMIGLKNAFSDVSGWSEISEEQVIDRNPDYIVTITMTDGSSDPVAEIEGRTGWSDISAVKNGTVYQLDSNVISRPGPRLAEGAQDLYDLVTTGSDEVKEAA